MNATVAHADQQQAHPSELSTERLEHEIASFAAHLAAAMCRWLLLVAEFDRRRAYEAWECLNTAQWLNLQVGISLNTGRQHVAVARQIERLPAVREAFAHGQLSYSRVRAICRVAEPENERRWLDVARQATASQLDRIVSDTIRAVRAAEPGASAAHEEDRSLSWFVQDNGMYEVRGCLPPEVGALLAKLVGRQLAADRATDTAADRAADRGSHRDDDFSARRADALAAILARDAAGRDGSVPAAHGDTASSVGHPPVLVVVHRYPDGTSRIEDGPAIPEDVADRLACGSDEIIAVHTKDSIRYGRRRRAPTASMRRYLHERDEGCRFPGCGQRSRLHAHHVTFFSNHGATGTDNLVMLCPRHHGAIHHRGWSVSGNPETGTVTFRDRTGRVLTTDLTTDPATDSRRAGSAEVPLMDNLAAGVNPTSTTIRPQGGGGRYDHHLTVSVLSCSQVGAPPAPPS